MKNKNPVEYRRGWNLISSSSIFLLLLLLRSRNGNDPVPFIYPGSISVNFDIRLKKLA